MGCAGTKPFPSDNTDANADAGAKNAIADETSSQANVAAAANHSTDAYTHCHAGHPGDIDRHDHGDPGYTHCHHSDPNVAAGKPYHRSAYRHRNP